MYQLTYDSKILFDPYMQSTAITDAKYTGKSNSVSYLDFTIAPNHPLYNTIEKDKGLVEFYSDNVLKFRGKINEIEIDNYGYKIVSCNSVLQYLNHTRVRSYSTVPGDADLTAPTSVEGYFQWLIDQHNLHVKDASERFEVGVNQGAALDKNDYILRSNDNYPTTLDEINYKVLDSLGGYLFVEYKDDRNILNLYADVHSTNSQIIDFGSNILSVSYKENDDELYTVVIPRGGTPEKKEGDTKDPKPINIKNLPDNTFDTDSDIVKSGDCVYSLSATKRYGYREYYYSNNDILDPSNLLKAAVLQLRLQMSPKVTIEAKAIDLSIAYPGYEQLNIGDACRVRSARHNLDDYFMLSEMELDLNDPSQTTYTFGDEYVSLVGRQSNYLKQINSSIDRNYEDVNTAMNYGKAAAKLADTANKTADAANNTAVKANDKAQKATEDAFNANTTANKAQETANTANTKAENAQTSADNAQAAADANKAEIDAANAEIEAAKQGIADAEAEIGLVNGRIDSMNDEIGAVNSSIDSANERINTLNGQIETVSGNVNTLSNDLNKQVTDLNSQIETVSGNVNTLRNDLSTQVSDLNSKIETTSGSVDSLRTEVSTEVQNVKDSVDAVSSKADSAMDKASVLAGNLDATKAVVNKHSDKIGELTTSISNATTKADSALKVATEATQTANSFKTTATTAYKNANEALTQSSTAVQKADEVSLNLSTNYQTKADSDALYATQASLKATSDSITSTVEKTYATKSSVETLQNIADSAIETWVGSVAPTGSNKPASGWNTTALKKQHSGDIYYDTSTGYSYRYGSVDGTTYSWTMIKDSDIQKAIRDAADAQLAANGAQDSIDKLALDIPNIYATKTELTQTSDSIKASVSGVTKTANSALSKATTVEQTVNGLKTTVSEQATKLNNTVKTVSEVKQTADSLTTQMSQVTADVSNVNNKASSALTKASSLQQSLDGFKTNVSQTYETKSDALAKQSNLTQSLNGFKAEVSEVYATNKNLNALSANMIKNPGFETGDFTNWTHTDVSVVNSLYVNDSTPLSGTYKAVIWFPSTDEFRLAANSIAVVKGHTYEISCWIWSDNTVKIRLGFLANGYDATNELTVSGTNGWQRISTTWTFKSDLTQTFPRIIFPGPISSSFPVRLDNFEVRDITEGYSAISKASSLEQSLDGLKTTVSQTYETKADALNKQSTLNQTIDGFRTNVSQTYETKSDALAKQSSLNQTLDGFKANVSQTYETKQEALNKQSTLNQKIDGFKTTVSQTYTTKTDFNNLQIGGTNRALLTGTPKSLTGNNTSNQTMALYNMAGKGYELFGGDDVMISYDITASGSTLSGTYVIQGNGNTGWAVIPSNPYGKLSDIGNGKTMHVVHKAKFGPDQVNNFNGFRIRMDNASGTLTISNFKIEKGNKATSWSPAPEDIVNTYSTKSEVAQTANSLTSKISQVATNASNANDKASSALTKASSLEQSLNGFKTNVSQTYETKADALNKKSTLEQTIDGFKTNVAQTYETKKDALNKQSTLNQTLDGFKTTVSQTYATKTSLDATNGKVTQAQATGDQAIFAALPSMADKTQPDSWLCAIFPTGNGSVRSLPSYSLMASRAASDVEYKTDHGGVINSSGMDYHYGLIRTLVSFAADKTWTFTYSHDDGSRIYVDGVVVFESVGYITNDPATITFTKGNHIVDIMWSNVRGGYGVWGFSVPLSSIATTMYAPAGASALASDLANVKTTYATKSEVTQTANSLTSKISQVAKDAQSMNSAALIQNPGFETGDLTGWTADNWSNPIAEKFNKQLKGIGEYRFNGYAQQGTSNYSYLRSKTIFGATPGKTYKVSVSALYADYDTTAYMMLRRISDNARPQITKAIGPSWTSFSGELTVPSDWSIGDNVRFEFAVRGISSGTNRILADDFSIIDVTDAKTATDTANSALSQSSTFQQELTSFKTSVQQTYETKQDALNKQSTLNQTIDGFKTNVSQTYETKTDALNKQSTLNQKVDSLRSEVSETYATKTQLNNASSTTNMWPNQWFDTSKPCIGRAPVGNEIEAAPVGGNIRIIESRDHYNGSVSSPVMPGRKYKVSVDAKKVSGTKSVISGGIWYTALSSGVAWNGGGDFTNVKDYGNGWYRFERTVTVLDGKTMGTAWLQLSENTSSSTTAKWKISNLRFEDVTDIADIQANYSTKSYVDQTARTVSLGVVEEYKNGQHGSALATQSDISVAKDSIKTEVSQTYQPKGDYATNSGVAEKYATSTQLEQTSTALTAKISTAQNTANTANGTANSAKSQANNLDTLIRMDTNGVRVGKIVSGKYTGCSCLMNANGSFDIVDDNNNMIATFNANAVTLARGMFNVAVIGEEDLYIGAQALDEQQYYTGLVLSKAGNNAILQGYQQTLLASPGGNVTIFGRGGVEIDTGAGNLEVNGKVWDSVTHYNDSHWKVMSLGKIVSVSVNDLRIGGGSWDNAACPYVIPSELSPSTEVSSIANVANDFVSRRIVVKTNGQIVIQNMGGRGSTEGTWATIIYIAD